MDLTHKQQMFPLQTAYEKPFFTSMITVILKRKSGKLNADAYLLKLLSFYKNFYTTGPFSL